MKLMSFQKRFEQNAFNPKTRIAVLSVPRGNGKSTLCGYFLARCLTPGDELHQANKEYLLISGSIQQARHVFNAMLNFIEPDDYSIAQNMRELKATHKSTRATVLTLSSNAKTAMGLGLNNPLIVCDEPGAWDINKGYLMWQALRTSIGKPESNTKLIFIGTIAPAHRGWWPDLVESDNTESRYIQLLKGSSDFWSMTKTQQTNEIRRVNPLMYKFKESRQQLLTERDDAWRYQSEKAMFNSYRLNIPTRDEAETLLKPEYWKAILNREVKGKFGKPIVGVDLGGARSWSAAVAVYPNGFIDAIALGPGIPSISAQEQRDRVPVNCYQKLVDEGLLMIDEGRNIPKLEQLIDWITDIKPDIVLADSFRWKELKDNGPHLPIFFRQARAMQAAEDISALRKLAADGPLNVGKARELIAESLSVTQVKSDDQNNTRISKSNKFDRSRDDVSAALVFACGEFERRMRRKAKVSVRYYSPYSLTI